MGAHSFYTTSQGSTAKEAFNKAVQDARYEYGHGGYTGTIAEKNQFVMIECPKGAIPEEYANELLNNSDYTIVPAPSALALIGIAGMIGVRRRR